MVSSLKKIRRPLQQKAPGFFLPLSHDDGTLDRGRIGCLAVLPYMRPRSAVEITKEAAQLSVLAPCRLRCAYVWD